MKKVFSSDNMIDTGRLKAILEDHRITCIVKNWNLAGGIGELPPTEVWPELWIVEDTLYDKAARLVAAYAGELDATGPEWDCEGCGERSEALFTHCWKCGTSRDGFPPNDPPINC